MKMRLMNIFYVDLFPQMRANIEYLSIYEHGFVPNNNRGRKRSFDSYPDLSKHVECVVWIYLKEKLMKVNN